MTTHFKHVFLAFMFLLPAVAVCASETDSKIENSFKNSYVYKNYLDKDDVKIKSEDGIVTLSGTVSEEDSRSLAKETAASLPGVAGVDNKIEVKGDKHEEYSDKWLEIKIKTALLFQRSVSAIRTQIESKEGIVTLKGKAYSQAEKELVSEYVKDIEGVKGIKNEIEVVQTPQPPGEKFSEKIDDVSITAQVKLALLVHRSTSILHTGVSTQEGTVTITGKAKNQAEKDLVSKLVSDIKGVDHVVNNMEIAS